MARPREFDEDVVLEKAMLCFWEKGYDAASIADLEKVTGVSRISLYNAFGDKEGLFVAVQSKYHLQAKAFLEEMLSGEDMQCLLDLFAMLGEEKSDDCPEKGGCMMVNTVLNVNNLGERILDNVKSYRAMLVEIYAVYLKKCQDNGAMKKDVDVSEAAAFLLGSMWGAMAVTRLYHETSYARPHVNMVLSTIRSWKV